MKVIALTGGIGSGKSEAARQFAALGVPVVDTDVIAHELTAVGEPMLAHIQHVFGDDFISSDGTLNRAKLRVLIFENSADRLKLEALLHPAIYDRALKQLRDNENKLHPAYQVLVIPLLFESNRYDGVIDKILVIDCDESLQIKRAMVRSEITEYEVKKIMGAQIAKSARLTLADEVIVNNGTLAELRENVTSIHKKFIKTCIVSK